MKKLCLIISLFLGFYVNAQYICNPLLNTQLSELGNTQVLPHIAKTNDNEAYIAWNVESGNGFAVYLQRLNKYGETMWAGNGLLISNFPTESWIGDYSIICDKTNNCILTFTDIRNGNQDVSVYKISPQGDFLFGNSGITIPLDSDDWYPKAIVTQQNNIIIISSNYDFYIRLHKISQTGEMLWGQNGIIFQSGDQLIRYNNPLIINAEAENFFLIWTHETGSTMYPSKNIFAQKFNQNGETISTPAQLYSDGNIPIYYAPVAIKDNNFGAYIAWMCFDSGVLNCYINHIDNEGNATMTQNGVPLVQNLNYIRTMPQLALNNENNNAYVFWKQSNMSQTQSGIYGQQITAEGNIFWNESGQEIASISNSAITDLHIESNNKRLFVLSQKCKFDNYIDSDVFVYCVNNQGQIDWQTAMSSYQSEKIHLDFISLSDNNFVATWEDMRNSTSSIFYQNITDKGELGAIPYINKPIGDTLVCANKILSEYYINSSAYAIEYEWFIAPNEAGIISFTDTLASVQWNETYAGEASIIAQAKSECNTIHATSREIALYEQPSVNIGNDTTIYFPQTLTLDAGSGFNSYLWSDGTEEQTLTINSSNFSEGKYLFWVKATDFSGCIGIDSIIVDIQQYNNINNLCNKHLKVFPNIVKSSFFIEMGNLSNTNYELLIFNSVKSEVLRTTVLKQDKIEVNVSHLKSGVYFVIIRNHYFNFVDKIIIVH